MTVRQNLTNNPLLDSMVINYIPTTGATPEDYDNASLGEVFARRARDVLEGVWAEA